MVGQIGTLARRFGMPEMPVDRKRDVSVQAMPGCADGTD
jgi:hypothetical protein